jgi:TorA maturation chaperone TorD
VELFRTLGALLEAPTARLEPLAQLLGLQPLPSVDQHARLFLFQLYPYASVYLGNEGMLGGEAQDRISGFWRALALEPPKEPDHLIVMLACYAELCEREEELGSGLAQDRLRLARGVWLWEHLLSWLPLYLERLNELAPPFYRQWGDLLHSALVEEARKLPPPDELPLHLRASEELPDPREEGAEVFLGALLSPVRSGLLLTGSDLARAARDLGLGLRKGERRFVLRSLLAQEPAKVLGWLAREAERWEVRHGERLAVFGKLNAFWARRSARTAGLVQDLANSAPTDRACPPSSDDFSKKPTV